MTSHLFSPIKLAGLDLDNRIVIAPMCQYSADDGCVSDWHMTHLGMLANSGAALVIIEATGVERRGRITHGCVGLYSEAAEVALKRVIAHCHRISAAKFGIQLAHAGRKGSSQRPWEGGGPLRQGEDPWETIAPSAIPYGPGWHTPRAMTEADISQVLDAFACAALRAVRVGFDAIELHVAHGYLLHSFLSPIANKRTDQYGGTLENRLRFPVDVMRAVRGMVPSSIPVGARITGTDWMDGGITPDEAVALATAFKSVGCDYVDVSSGAVTAQTRTPTTPGYNVPIAEKIRREAGIATRTVGLIVTPQQAEDIVAAGKADMIAIGRGMLDDPHWGWHAAQALGAQVTRPRQYLRAGPALWPGAALRG